MVADQAEELVHMRQEIKQLHERLTLLEKEVERLRKG
jgi:hypothetical protein